MRSQTSDHSSPLFILDAAVSAGVCSDGCCNLQHCSAQSGVTAASAAWSAGLQLVFWS